MKERLKDFQLGVFVLTGTVIFIFALYLIGTKKNIFGSNIKIWAKFKNVNGLMEGNNVRFGGIDVGSIEKIEIVSDSNVIVEMLIEKNAGKYIRKNYIASIGTDGLMGNRLVNIHSEKQKERNIENGDVLETINPLETEEMLRAFNATGVNMKSITENLNAITIKLKENNALWELLGRKEMANQIQSFIVSINESGNKVNIISKELEKYSIKINDKKSFTNALTSDLFTNKISLAIDNFNAIEDSTKEILKSINQLSKKLNNGEGTVPKLINDSTTFIILNETLDQIRKSARTLNEDLEGLKKSIFLRRYFKKKS
ncbi:MAG: MlaD family protein [Bacteroidota bacterium]|jgi:phospholipid/cholesterol/gamma-HCH transport system substrate-binding protein